MLLVVVIATSAVLAIASRGAPGREIAERLARHAATIAAEHRADTAQLARHLRMLHEHLGVDVAVRDADGRLLARAGEPPPPAPPDMEAEARAGRVATRLHPVLWALAPVRDSARGDVAALVSVVVHRHFGRPPLTAPLVALAVVLLVVALATRPLARRLARPLERLTEAALRLSGGDLSVRVRDDARARRWRWRAGATDEIRDLTHAFNEMAERVEEVVRGQKEMLANLSHELRSPLARIRMALELLPRDAATEARVRDLEADLAELDRLIEDVLVASRLEATGLPAELAPVDVPALLASVADRARHDPVLSSSAVRVAEATSSVVVGDERLLRRALWNLVENAAKYGAPPITLSAVGNGTRVDLSVTDEGAGIPVDERLRVLEPFYRLDRARTPGATAARGVGLGLTLARRVAEAHGGSIAVGAAANVHGVDRGCRVTLSIPVAPGSDES